MKKYYKLFITLLLISFIVPQIALASWWNPFSWNIWNNIFHKSDTKEQILENRIKELESKLNTQSNPTPEISTATGTTTQPVKTITPITPKTTSTPEIKITDTKCQDIEKEFEAFNQKYNLLEPKYLNITKEFSSMYNFNKDFKYGYQRILADKDSYANLIQQFNKSIDDLPSLSFENTNELKQKFYDSSNLMQGAFDSLTLAFKYLSSAVGVPNNDYLIDTSLSIQKEATDKSGNGYTSYKGGLNIYKTTITTSYTTAHNKFCSQK